MLKSFEQKSKVVCSQVDSISLAAELRIDRRSPLQIRERDDADICRRRAGGNGWISDLV